MKLINKTESGRSMIEMLGVLAIIGVLSVGGLAGYNMAMGRVRVNRVIDELQLVAVNIRTAVPNGVYTGISGIASNMNILKTLNENLASLGANASASVTEQTSAGGQVNDRFAIVFANLPLDACRRIAGLDWGTESYVMAGTPGKSVATTAATKESEKEGTATTPSTGTASAIAVCASTDPIKEFALLLK